ISLLPLFTLIPLHPPNSTLFPSTTLFRSEAIQAFLDRDGQLLRNNPPRSVRAAIQEFVETEPRLAWARQPLPRPRPLYVINEKRSEEHTSELQSLRHLVCRLLLEKKNN